MRHTRLLQIGLLLSLVPLAPASATTEGCKTLQGIEPVSSYTRQVLARAKDAMLYARSAKESADFSFVLPGWVRTISSTALSLISTRGVLLESGRDLSEATACLRFDLLLIECTMEDVRDALNAAIRRGSALELFRLRALLPFLAERAHTLSVGARHPFYQDASWGKTYDFDPPKDGFCCKEERDDTLRACTKTTRATCDNDAFFQTEDACIDHGCTAVNPDAPAPALCPFHTDYLPPQLSGFGCDESVLLPRIAHTPLAGEYQALSALTTQLESLQRSVLEDFPAKPESQPREPAEARQHLKEEGCRARIGECSKNADLSCVKDSDCDGVTPQGICLWNNTPSPGFVALRGPFSLFPDWLRLTDLFSRLRAAQGEAREEASSPGLRGTSSSLARLVIGSPLEQVLRATARSVFRVWNKAKGQDEARILPATDGPTSGDGNSLSALRSAIGDLSRLAAKPDGLRTLVTNFAFWLRRTCMDRPCNERLDTILKLALSPDQECFPYVSGLYLRDSCTSVGEKSRSEKCATAAGLTLPPDFFPTCSTEESNKP